MTTSQVLEVALTQRPDAGNGRWWEQVRWVNDEWPGTGTRFVGFDPSTVEAVVVVQPETDDSLRQALTGNAYRRVMVEQLCEVWVRAA